MNTGTSAEGVEPRPRRRNVTRRDNEAAIMAAAVALLNADPRATMSEVAVRAGVGRATLHRHFRTRADLVRAIGAKCIDEMDQAVRGVDALQAPPGERLRAMFDAVIPLGEGYNFLRFETVDDEVVRTGYRAQLRWTAALVEELKAAGHIAPDVPSRWAVGQIDELVWAAWKAVSDGYLDAPGAARLACRTLLDGLRRPPGEK